MRLHSGLGAACSPLVATQFAQLRHWSFHFLCSLGIALVNNVILLLVFRGKTQDGEITVAFYPKRTKVVRMSTGDRAGGRRAGHKRTEQISSDPWPESRPPSCDIQFDICRYRSDNWRCVAAQDTLLRSSSAYLAIGWTVTYIIDRRHVGASSGYVSTGFFGGS